MTDVLGTASIEDYQKRVSDAVYKYDNVAVKACHSVGKTWLMARVALWFFYMYEDSIVITTAPTHRQVRALLWGELRDAYKSSKVKLGGKLLDTSLNISDKWFAMGFSPQTKAASTSKEQQGSTFQGFHSRNILIIFDEGVGVPDDVWVMAQGLLTSGVTVKFVSIANPTTKNCKFFECFSDPSWHSETITCFDSPNLIANGLVDKESLQDEIDRLSVLQDDERITEIQSYKKPVPYLLTAQFVVPYVMRLGLEHPLVLSKVFGEFPKTEDNVLVQYEDVQKAVERVDKGGPYQKRFIGVDVARFGVDKTVITELRDYDQTDLKVLVKRDIPFVTGQVINQINEDKALPCIVAVDATGLGAGVYDLLVEKQREKIIGKNVQIVEVHFGGGPANPDQNKEEQDQEKARYANLKAKIFDLLGDDVRHKMSLLNESIYAEELPTIEYKFDSKGRIVIESKKDYKARTGRPSPDYSDSLALANYCRYVNIQFGSFKGHTSEKPLVKQSKRKRRKAGIRVKEY
ncbi:MAG: hypothetical protein GY861_17950 [bacterium]|nr:hypothetical protein [bacterium]